MATAPVAARTAILAPRRALLATGVLLALGAAGRPVRATDAAGYPHKPIRLVVPFPPGGGGDTLARLVMPRVAQTLGQAIVIDNRPGAGGNVGADAVAHAAPDGYTLLYGTNGTHAINAALYRNLSFDPLRDFVPVARLTDIATLLVVHPQLPVHDVAGLIRYARAHPGRLNFASAGNGTTSHLAGEMLRAQAGIELVHVPYRGGAAAMTDLIAGQVQLMIDVMPNAWPQAQAGRVRALAVGGAQRFAGTPQIPTIAEAGLRGFDASAWDGIFAPAGTPPAIVERLNAVIRQALEDPEIEQTLRARGAQPVPGSPEEFARFVRTSAGAWAAAVRASGAKID